MNFSLISRIAVVSAAALLASGLPAAKKDRKWQTGTLSDSQTVSVGTRTTVYPVYGGAPPLPATTRPLTATELQITTPDYIYVVRDQSRKRCRYIVGDKIQYAQEKAVMYLLDADGAECKAQVMKQSRVVEAPPAKP